MALLQLRGQPVSNVRAWLTAVVRRRHIDTVRRQSCERLSMARVHAWNDVAAVDPQDRVADVSHAAWLVTLIDTLPKTTQAVCRAVARGEAVAHFAVVLGLTVRSVESHLTRARRRLRTRSMEALAVDRADGSRPRQWCDTER